MAGRSVLVSGAGIAGATVAYWLARTGWQVTVVEKAVEASSSGNPVDVRGEAASVVHQMGLWSRLQERATGVTRLVVVDGAGGRRAVVGTRRTPDPAAEVEVVRADLAGTLLEAVRRDVELVEGDSVVELAQDEDGVDVRLASAGPRRFDLVVGADGLHSGVRGIAFGPEESFARPFGMFVGTMRTALDGGDPREVRLYNRPGISLSVHPAAGHPLAAFIFRSRQAHDRSDPQARRRLVQAAYSGQGWVSDDAVAEWLAADDVYFDAVTRVTLPTWTQGRVTLLGDAADCISLLGEGSSNAIVAAKTLSDALGAHPEDHRAALAAYEATHRHRLRTVHRRAGAGAHFLVPGTRIGLAVRDAGLRLATSRRPAPG